MYIAFTPKDKVIVMENGINQHLNEIDSITSILSSENFLNLDPNLQNKIINTVYNGRAKDGGVVGKFLGNRFSNAAINISFILCALLVLVLIIDSIHSYFINESINMDLVDRIIPVISLSIGYIFGKGSH